MRPLGYGPEMVAEVSCVEWTAIGRKDRSCGVSNQEVRTSEHRCDVGIIATQAPETQTAAGNAGLLAHSGS